MRTLAAIIVLFLGATGLGTAAPAPPRLAGAMPEAEAAILDALQRAGLADRVVRIAADSNGHITVAAVSFTYRATGERVLPGLQDYAWALATTAFAAVPQLDEIDLTGFHGSTGGFDARRHDGTFTAAVTARDLARLPAGLSGPQAFGSLFRVWYYPTLLSGGEAQSGTPRSGVGTPEGSSFAEHVAAFSGPPAQRQVEAVHQLAGRRAGGIVQGKLYRGDPATPRLALTFDDGPEPLYTTLLLDTLDRIGVQATFFLVGMRVQQYPYLAQAIVRRGHEIGNHSFHHVNLARVSDARLQDELARTQRTISLVTGVTPQFFRPPGGDYNLAVLRAARDLGLVTVFWTDDPGDYARPSPLFLEAKLLARVNNGGILLLHQGVRQTIEILPQVAAVLRREGFVLTTAGGLLGTPPRSR